MRVEGVAALVTGGASGLGAAVVRRLLADGARVTALDLPAAWEGFGAGGEFRTVGGDVRRAEDVARALAAAADDGPLRVAVASAGVAPVARLVGRRGPHELEPFRDALEVNLIGTFNLLRLAAAAMAEAALEPSEESRGVVVTIGSIAAEEGQVGQVAYTASKAGVAGMTLPAARDLASRGVRVVCVAPGAMDTPMLDALLPERLDALAAAVPHPQRLGRPAELAALVAHIVANDYLNGVTIRLDGALRLGPG